MRNILKESENYLQFLTSLEQITEINHAIQDILTHKKVDDNINKKYRIMKQLNTVKEKLLHTHNENNA